MERQHHYRWMRRLGLGFILFPIVLRVIWVVSGNESQEQGVLFERLHEIYDKSKILLWLFACLYAPIVEEFVCRIWTTQKRWACWASCIGITVYACILGQWILGIAAGVVVATVCYWFKNLYHRNWALAITTSLFFSLAHINGFGEISPYSCFILLQFFGIAMFNCYLGLRFRWIWGVVTHMIINFLSISSLILSNFEININPNTLDGVSSGAYEVAVCDAAKEQWAMQYVQGHQSLTILRGKPAEIYCSLLKMQRKSTTEGTSSDTLFEYTSNIDKKYTLFINFDYPPEDSIADYKVVINLFKNLFSDEKNIDFNIDTLSENPVRIIVSDK